MHSPARIVGYTAAASLGLHGVLLLLAAWLITVVPARERDRKFSIAPSVSDEPAADDSTNPPPGDVEVTFVSMEEVSAPELSPAALPPDAPAPPKSRRDITVIAPEDQPALAPLNEDTPFVSSQTMRAASTAAPIPGGDPNLASQNGADLPGLSLTTAEFADGNSESAPPATPATPPPADVTPSPAEAREPREAPPAVAPATSESRPPEPQAVVQTNDPLAPAPAPEPAETPPMRDRPLESLTLTDISRSTPPPPPPPPPAPRDPVTAAPGTPDSTKKQRPPTVSSVKSKIDGGVTSRGNKSSLDARDTPEGRYNNEVYERIGILWNRRLADVRGLAGVGAVEVEFEIDPKGRVSDVRLVDPGKANPVLEDVCLAAIRSAKLPPPPASMQREMSDPLTGGKLRRKFSFHRL